MMFRELDDNLVCGELLRLTVYENDGTCHKHLLKATFDSSRYESLYLKCWYYHVTHISALNDELHVTIAAPEEPKEEMPEIASIREMFDDLMQEFEECGVGGLL